MSRDANGNWIDDRWTISAISNGGGNGGGGNGGGTNPLDALSGARAYSSEAVGATKSGLNAVLGGQGQVNAAVNNMNKQANAAIADADKAKATYAQLGPLAALLGGYGDNLWGEGEALSEQAKDIFGQAGAMMRMDPDAGGLAGEFIKYWQSLSPDRYVSQAASDTQGAYQNAQGQAQRDLARRGVSPTSGAFGALQRQFGSLMATAIAAAKTKARQVGLDQQAAQLDKMVSAANTFYNMGNQMESQSLAAKGQAANDQNAAAGIKAQEAQGYVTVGGLQLNAGQLFGTAAQINNSYLSLVNQAYGQVAQANSSAAATEMSAARELNSGGGGGGGAITKTFPHYDLHGNLIG